MTRRRPIVFSLLIALTASALWWQFRRDEPSRPVARARSVVLVTIDTWRADRLTPALMPRLAAIAGHGTLFRAARSPVPLTLPAHVSLMTGLLPSVHGVRENGRVLPREVPRLSTWLRAAGYDTAAFVGAFVLDRRFGLAEGFDLFDDRVARDARAPDRLEAERPASEVVDAAVAWLDARPRPATRPYFLWVHVYDPHAPYRPPSGVPADTAPYDAEIRYTDEQVGRLLDALGRHADRERPLVVVAGDHGESLGDHGERTHGMLLYEAALRVPVVVHGPGVESMVREDPIGLIDLAPTILARCGAPAPAGLDGIDVLASASAPDREMYSETEYPRAAGWSPLSSIVAGRWKLIASSESELYDLQEDPEERSNVIASRHATAVAMQARIAALRDRHSRAAVPARPSQEVEERLRALGYVAPAPLPQGTMEDSPPPARVIDGWVEFEHVLDRLAAGRAAEAIPAARMLAERFPAGHVFQMTYARALQEGGRSREALAAYRAAARRFSSSAPLLHDLAVAARAAADPAEALRAERAALAIDPSYAAAHNGLGLALTDLREWAEAAAAFTEAARLDPRHPPFLVNLANARRELSDFAGAEAAYAEALVLEPSNADAANGLGTIFVVTGRAAEAIPWFERALATDPQFVGARLNLGIACQEAGRTAEAEAAYRTVLEAPAAFDAERRTARTLLDKMPRR
jgi:arylsulfatase A-like enzyme/Flp pilus assembly protein TadD